MKKLIIITCTSYTTVTIVSALLSQLDMALFISANTLLQLFFITFLIAVTMLVLDKVEDKYERFSLWADGLIRIVICYVFVLLGGFVFGWFPVVLQSVLLASPIILITFFITYLVSYLAILDYATNINKILKKEKNNRRK